MAEKVPFTEPEPEKSEEWTIHVSTKSSESPMTVDEIMEAYKTLGAKIERAKIESLLAAGFDLTHMVNAALSAQKKQDDKWEAFEALTPAEQIEELERDMPPRARDEYMPSPEEMYAEYERTMRMAGLKPTKFEDLNKPEPKMAVDRFVTWFYVLLSTIVAMLISTLVFDFSVWKALIFSWVSVGVLWALKVALGRMIG